MKLAFNHTHAHLQTPWNLTQIGLLIFPFSPFVGGVSILLAALITCQKQYRTVIHRPLHWGFALLSVLLIISCSLAHEKTQAFLGLFNLLPFFVVFAGLSTLIKTPAQLRQITGIFIIGSIPVVVMGFGQMFWGWSFQWRVLWILLDLSIAPGGEPPGRMASIFMHANLLAAYLAITFTLGLGLWLEQWTLSMNPLSSNSKIQTIFLTVSVIISLVALILTNSRNGWAMAMVACLAYALYQGWHLLVCGVIGLITSVLLAAFAPSPGTKLFRRFIPAFFWARLNDQMYPDRPVALMRTTQWKFAWSLTQQQPWTGWGLRSFSDLYRAKMHIDLGHPHNLFLMLSAETGLPSAILFFACLGWVWFAAVQLLQKSYYLAQEDKLMFFSYIVVVLQWLIFNTVDISLFDFRLNTISWLLFSALWGVAHYKGGK
ncbi:O-antigen ligase family protein [Umezakia ovalisporum]|uniref:O-antigen ligase family protein n=1 Tax=Umezakia ovalisporum FSS-62 TaxID=2971776 RepID=A0AA43GY99_9CYAN|nr:O-antigen ligase family protein [Umezakia ovalisporum]MDH6063715.1 O-antigen ligase family protein [Umezakia ovalisporum FSS-62]MDH6083848.1 O-antigen ligase family protein [Umezakia ovalisporum TAC611]MDH6089904.1 O-antigen ligase family protein [Umezakia ovalisporum Ak1311]